MDVTSFNMTEEDFKKMKPDMLVKQWAKLQEVAHNLASERDQLRQELSQRNTADKMVEMRLTHALAREARQQRMLSAFGEKMIALGVLDALSLSVKEGDQ